ncbi:carboxylesterase/lipase family protein [Streptomonospora sp. PA3]|uniref:carboxylesterase/lipase family protein n=1 Tax=Streptomonospora sp. PA3 TaxID=2607326 RepID=UPI0012DD57A7|nr:carboxylesterase family protein [Streptomonospora sp. PA3]MUL40035.1 carboxylesterase/lipase family protein [Streptomonospora sp. PA3]
MQALATITSGRLSGAVEGGVSVFRGIPYAAPPVGEARLAAPRPPEPWTGVREAVEYGPTAPHPPYEEGMADTLPERVIPGDEYLNLNVWTPGTGERGLPVMVWIHGGAFTNGSGAEPGYEASAFARSGAVAVTLNYRLGAEGFALVDGAPANRGLLDQIAALEWVRDNIAAFGGDPGRVTVFGESAGAMSVVTLMAIPRARALFRRAIAQSGAGHTTLRAEDARTVARVLAERLGVAPTGAGLGAVPAKRLQEEQSRIVAELRGRADKELWGERLTALGALPFSPAVDGELLARRPIDALRAGEAADKDLLIGTTTEEYRLFLAAPGLIDHIREEHVAAQAAGTGLAPEAAGVYLDRNASPGDALAELGTDAVFRIPAHRVLEARAAAGGSGGTFGYEFAWRSPRFGGRLGACHALEIPFVFDNLGDGRNLAGPRAPQPLADAMHTAWLRFAAAGDPGWPQWDPGRRPFMRFDDPESALVEDPHARTRRLWEGLLD